MNASAVLRNQQFRSAAHAYENAEPDSSPSIYDDQNLIEGALGIEPDWLSDAIGYALSSGDWEYAKRQITKHAEPILVAAERELRP